MRTVVGVLAEPPIAGACKKGLLAAHGEEWVAGLYAAMLRDVLDGAQSIDAASYVALTSPVPSSQVALEVLVRHVPVPWKIVAQPEARRGARIVHGLGSLLASGGAEETAAAAVLFTADAPSFDPAPLVEAAARIGHEPGLTVAPTESGDIGAIATGHLDAALYRDVPWETPAAFDVLRARCREHGVPLRALPAWYAVDAPSDVLRLAEELRSHPERAPRSAQYLVTHA